MAIVSLCALVIGAATTTLTWAAFSAQATSPGNSFDTGTVSITDNDGGTALFNAAAIWPGSPISKCIQVTYTGTLPAGVRLYGATTAGTGLEAYLELTVVRGTVSNGTFPDCASFTADSTDHIGLGPGVLYSGPLSGFAIGVTDPGAAWSTNDRHAYKLSIDLADTIAAEGKTVTETFVWEAR
ncbi:hypothetical protein ACQEVZ_39590 [Dactylosporangium sp. CA-152071]|uniref:hypothetical protein n=1 Tax=Dactylosporangium sp. CA-152071 TaxID=3239933 RepID=UPI003D92ABBD